MATRGRQACCPSLRGAEHAREEWQLRELAMQADFDANAPLRAAAPVRPSGDQLVASVNKYMELVSEPHVSQRVCAVCAEQCSVRDGVLTIDLEDKRDAALPEHYTDAVKLTSDFLAEIKSLLIDPAAPAAATPKPITSSPSAGVYKLAGLHIDYRGVDETAGRAQAVCGVRHCQSWPWPMGFCLETCRTC